MRLRTLLTVAAIALFVGGCSADKQANAVAKLMDACKERDGLLTTTIITGVVPKVSVSCEYKAANLPEQKP